jgi:hypothetical protein
MMAHPDPSYQLVSLVSGEQGILCRTCGLVSWNPHDVEEKYCGKCCDWHQATSLRAGVQNQWLAEMAYLTWQRLSRYDSSHLGQQPWPETFDALCSVQQHAWLAAAAAVRRRVVGWGLTAEEEP